MSGAEVRQKFLDYFVKNGHKIVPSSSLIPEGDTTTLFTGSGMQPLLPYLLGKVHPSGKRIVNSQKSFRAEDVEEVGDNRHTTFFEMLGNWSFGDYFKKEQLPWFFEFLTKEVGLDPKRIYVTVFAGDEASGIPRDTESVEIWKKLFLEKGIEAKDVELLTVDHGGKVGMQGGRIFYYGLKNWWSRVGPPSKMPPREPGGPDSEVFYEFAQVEHDQKFGRYCHPNCDCGRFVEIGNSVFLEYKKKEDGTFEALPQRNVDFGGGLERIVAASNDNADIFSIDVFIEITTALEKLSTHTYKESPEITRSFRIVADHVRAAIFLIADGALPSNKDRGYVVRRLIRRAVTHSNYLLHLPENVLGTMIDGVIDFYKDVYPELDKKRISIKEVFIGEQDAFVRAYARGKKELDKKEQLTGEEAFDLYQSFGLPPEVTQEFRSFSWEDFTTAKEKHISVSGVGQEKKFGGHGLLLDTGEIKARDENELKIVTRLHTATHMLQQALRDVLGPEVRQAGSDITAERTRFDFTFGRKLTAEEIKKVEARVNEKMKEDLPVAYVELPKAEAEKTGALFFFKAKYGDIVKVYYMGKDLATAWSKEFCGGPHVNHTNEVGEFKIIKEEAVGGGVRRIRGVVL